MKYLQILSTLFIASASFSIAALAQQPVPTPFNPAKTTTEPTIPVEKPAAEQEERELRSLSTVTANEKFVSKEGRFSIALPKDIAEVEARFDKDAGETGGAAHTWQFAEGVIIVVFTDDPSLVIKSEQDYIDLATGAKEGLTGFGDVKVIAEKRIDRGGIRGHEIVFENQVSKGVSWSYVSGKTIYAVIALTDPATPESIDLLTKSLNTLMFTSKPKTKKSPRRK